MKYYCKICGKEFDNEKESENDKCSEGKNHILKKKALDKLTDASSAFKDSFQKIDTAASNFASAIKGLKSANESLGNPMGKGIGFISEKISKKTKDEKKIDNSVNESVREEMTCPGKKGEANSLKSSEQILEEGKLQKNTSHMAECSVKENPSEEVKHEKKDSKKSALGTFENQLQICSENPEYSIAVKNMIAAELGTLKLLKSPNSLLLQNFSDLVMEHLLISYDNIDDEHEKDKFQKNAGLLIRSIISYLQARIAFLEDEETGAQDLVDNAANDIYSVSISILKLLKSNESKVEIENIVGTPVGVKVGKISIERKINQQSIEQACDELRKIKSFGIFARMFFANKKIEKEKEIFYSFLAELFENLNKYRFVFGENNRILALLIERYGKIIADEFYFSEDVVINGLDNLMKKQPSIAGELPKFPREPSVFLPSCIVFFVIVLIDFAIIYAIRDFTYFILFMVLIVILSIIAFIGVIVFLSNEIYDNSSKEARQEKINNCWKETANIYYRALAKTFYNFG